MNTHHREHLRSLDRAIASMVDERARLLASTEEPLVCAFDDLLSRYDGPLTPTTLRTFFIALESATRSEARP